MATIPSDLSDLVFWLDAGDRSTLGDANGDGRLERWTDKSGRGHDATEASSDRQPQIVADAFNGRDALSFDGVDDRLKLADSGDLNTAGPYTAKTILMAFKTGDDVDSRQTLFEQGGHARGLNVYIDDGTLHMGGWNRAEAAWGPSHATTAIAADTAYVIALVFDQAAGSIEGFVDGTSIGKVGNVGLLYRHTNNIGIGATVENSYFHDGKFYGNDHHFQGLIGEIAYYNRALGTTERGGVESYLQSQWQGPPNQNPLVDDDTGTTDQNTPVAIDLLANDSDGDGDVLHVQSIDTSGTTGKVVLSGAGVTYDPDGKFDFLGDAETALDFFTYVAADGRGGSAVGVVAVTVSGTNDAPIAGDDGPIAVAWGQATNIAVLDNDTDPDWSDALAISAVGAAANGSVVINGATAITYTPSAGFAGTDRFSYVVNDGQGGSDSATVTVEVALPSPPDSLPDLVMWLDAGDEASLAGAAAAGTVAGWFDRSGHGNDASQATGGFQPRIVAAGINGRDAIAFDGIDDRLAIADSADINVGGPYSGKTLVMVFKTGADVSGRQVLFEQGGYARGLNFYIDDGALYLNAWNLREQAWGPSFAKTAIAADTVYTAMLVYDQANGRLEGFVDGASIGGVDGVDFLNNHSNNTGVGATIQNSYFHDGAFHGEGHHFEGLIGELAYYNRALTATDRTSIGDYLGARWLDSPNQAPTAVDDGPFWTAAGRALDISVLANDFDPNPNAVLSIFSVDDAAYGSVRVNPDNTVTYQPDAGFTGTDTFSYDVADQYGDRDQATVTIKVYREPEARDDRASINPNATTNLVTGDLLDNDDGAVDNSQLVVATSGQYAGHYGTLTLNADGSYSYALDKANASVVSMAYGDILAETFDYAIRDNGIPGGLATASAVLAIDVTAATQPLDWRLPEGVILSGDQGGDSLLLGNRWIGGPDATTILTYSFGGDQSVYDPNYALNEPSTDFAAFTEAQKIGVRKALQEWSNVADLSFVEVLDSDTVAGDIRFARSSVPSTAHAYYPNPTQEAGDVWFSHRASYLNMDEGTYGFQTGLHEIGHTLGLVHPHARAGLSSPLPTDLDWVGVSVMSYSSFPGANLQYGSYSQLFYPDTPMFNDIVAIQHLYGANNSHNQNDTIYSWAPGESILETIWDAGGSDWISWANQDTDALINLTPGSWSEIGPAYVVDVIASPDVLENRTLMIARDAVIENAAGGAGNDRLYGNQFANQLEGGMGNDLLAGQGGADVLDGGGGDDVFEIIDGAFAKIMGGAGDDLIRLDAAGWVVDLTAGLATAIAGIEAVDLGGGGNSLIVDRSAVLRLSDTSNTLTVFGGPTDDLELLGAWDFVGQSQIDGTLFDKFESSAILVLAEVGLGEEPLAGSAEANLAAAPLVGQVTDEPVSDDLLDTAIRTAELAAGDSHLGFLGGISHLGTEAADTMVGTEWADVMVGQDGNDEIHGQGGGDGLMGNAGDDLLIVADNDFQRIDGGTGHDRFRLDWSDGLLDLSGAGGERLSGIEEIDLAGQFNRLELDLATLSRLASASGQLDVTGDATNAVAISLGGTFTMTEESGFVSYSDGSLSLSVAEAIDQQDILIG